MDGQGKESRILSLPPSRKHLVHGLSSGRIGGYLLEHYMLDVEEDIICNRQREVNGYKWKDDRDCE